MNNNNTHENEQHAKRIRLFSKSNRLKALIVLGVVFLGINGIVWAHYGIMRGGDSPRYESGSQNLLQGKPLQGKQVFYPGYIAVVALAQWLGAGPVGVVAIQIALSGVAALALYDLGCRLSGPIAGFLAALFFAANPDIAQWNTYILPDSLYISAVILTVWSIYNACLRKGFWYLGAALIAIATASIRPNGWILIPIAGLYWALIINSRKSIRWLSISLTIAVLVVILLTSLGSRTFFSTRNPFQMLLRGEVVWGYEDWQLRMPSGGETSDKGLVAILRYAIQHPIAAIRLAIYRVGACLAHLRPYYSFRRNLVLFVFIGPLYIFGQYGFMRHWRDRLAILLTSVIAGHLLIVALTFADWDGRFLVYVLPLIGIFSACGAEGILSSWLEYLLKIKETRRKDAL